MGLRDYVHHGHYEHFLGTKDAAPIYPDRVIKLFAIGEEKFVGAEYPDGARQAQPLEWQSKEIIAALLNQQQEKPRPTLKHRETRPLLKRR